MQHATAGTHVGRRVAHGAWQAAHVLAKQAVGWCLVGALGAFVFACNGESKGGKTDGGLTDGQATKCAIPPLLVAGTAATNTIADAPARCGQKDYRWLRDGVGKVVSTAPPSRMSVEVIKALVAAQGLSLPVAPTRSAILTQYTYTTQDRGKLVEATGLYAAPEHGDPTQTSGTLLFLHGTLGVSDGCSASNDLPTRVLAALAASLGYDVVVPDLLGLKASGKPTGFLHPYLVGEATALASLDAIRAAIRLDPGLREGRCLGPEFLLIGASQGGHAGLFVERYAPVYARELSIRGAAVAVAPAALHAQFLSRVVDNRPEDGILLAAVTAMAQWYEVSDGLAAVFNAPWAERIPDMLLEKCDLYRSFDVPEKKEQLFTPIFIASVAQGHFPEPWECILRANDLLSIKLGPANAERPPTLFVTGESDEYVNTSIERKSYLALCDGGLPTAYLECEAANHAEASVWALPEALAFLSDRAAGSPLADTCTQKAVATRCSGTPN